MECQLTYVNNHKYIIMAVNYFTKWVEAMPTFINMVATATLFFIDHDISQFMVLKQLGFDHSQHFEDEVWRELSSLLGFLYQYSSSDCPQGNG